MSTWEKRFEEKPRRTAFNVGVSVILVATGLSFVGGAAFILTAPLRTVTGIVDRVSNPDNVLANYEWFKRQVQDVKAIDVRLEVSRQTLQRFEASAGSRTAWTFEDKQEHSRLSSIILGLEGQRAAMVAEYNARTQMANRDIFRTNDLPETLN